MIVFEVTVFVGHVDCVGWGWFGWECWSPTPYRAAWDEPTWFQHHERGWNRAVLLGAYIASGGDL